MKKLYQMINELLESNDRIIISIDGRCASGKSTLAQHLKEKNDGVVFHMDDYFLPTTMKTKERLEIPGGNVHYERMIDEIFSKLHQDSISYQKFNCKVQELEPLVTLELPKVIIVEGVYSQQDKLRDYFDLNVFLTIESKSQQDRLKKRNAKMYNRFINEWIPLEEVYFKKQNIEERADIVMSV